MADGDGQITRRGVMALLGAMSGAGAAAAGLSGDNGQGNLSGGTMALSEPYNVSGDLWIGPDSAKDQVDAKSGRIYIGASGDGYTFYNGDSGSWKSKGLGDSANPLPSVNTERLGNIAFVNEHATSGSGTDDDPWVDGYISALDDATSGSSGVGMVFFPPGVYKITKSPPNLCEYAEKRQTGPISPVDELYVLPEIRGGGKHTTTVYLDSGINESLFKIHMAGANSNIPANETAIGPKIADMTIFGDHENNTAGDGVEITNAGNGRRLFFPQIDSVYVRRFQENGISIEGAARQARVVHCDIDRCNNYGLRIVDKRSFYHDLEFNHIRGDRAVSVEGDDNRFVGLRVFNSDKYALRIGGNNNVFMGVQMQENAGGGNYAIVINGGHLDNKFNDLTIDCNNETQWGIVDQGNGTRLTNYDIFNYTTAPINRSGTNLVLDGTITDSYTGDGATGRTISLPFTPQTVIVEESGGNMEMVQRGMSRAVLNGSSMAGELSITNDGFVVGDNSGDADPNTQGETYQYRAIA